MTHVDLSGTLLRHDVYASFVEEVVSYISVQPLTMSELISLVGLLANKVYQFELLSSKEKEVLFLHLLQDAKQKVLEQNPLLSEQLDKTVEFANVVLPSVLETIAVASSNALAAPVKKSDNWKQCLEVPHLLSCFSCYHVEAPVAMPNKKEYTQLGTQPVVVQKKPVAKPVSSPFDILEPATVPSPSNKETV